MRLQLFKAGPKQENARGSCGPLQCISGSVSDEFPHCLRAFRGLAAPWSVAASPMPPRTNSSHSLSRFSVPNEARRSVSFDYARPQQSRPEKCVPAHVGDFLNAQDDRHLDVPRESLSGHDPPSLRTTLTLRAKREMRISSSPLNDLCNSSGAAGSLHKEENEELGTKDA